MLHQDKDADEFRPDRFANGVAAVCRPSPHMYMPFGHGPRTCIGQNLAMVELKVVLVRLLSKFAFSLSSGYTHAPLFRLTVEPRVWHAAHRHKAAMISVIVARNTASELINAF